MINSGEFNYDSVSHGQIKSKLWLCESIEPYLPIKSSIAILGSWYNMLGFMLLTRNNKTYDSIVGIDQDESAVQISNKILNYWVIEHDTKFRSINADVNSVTLNNYNVIINCSPEHMENIDWFTNIQAGSLVCIQTSNVTDPNYPWLIKNPSPDINSFVSKYPLKETLFLDTLPIRYKDWGYDRYMLIGIK
jgi:hypothetical protein